MKAPVWHWSAVETAYSRTERLQQVRCHFSNEHLGRCGQVHSPIECAKLLANGRITKQGFVNACIVHFCNQPDVRTKGTGRPNIPCRTSRPSPSGWRV
jgi:hypothetical protein